MPSCPSILCTHALLPHYWSYLGEGNDSIVYCFVGCSETQSIHSGLQTPQNLCQQIVCRSAGGVRAITNLASSHDDLGVLRTFPCCNLNGLCLRIPKRAQGDVSFNSIGQCISSPTTSLVTMSNITLGAASLLPKAIIPNIHPVIVPFSFTLALAHAHTESRGDERRALWPRDLNLESNSVPQLCGTSQDFSRGDVLPPPYPTCYICEDHAGKCTSADVDIDGAPRSLSAHHVLANASLGGLVCELMEDHGVFLPHTPRVTGLSAVSARDAHASTPTRLDMPSLHFASTSLSFEFKPKWAIMRPSAAVCPAVPYLYTQPHSLAEGECTQMSSLEGGPEQPCTPSHTLSPARVRRCRNHSPRHSPNPTILHPLPTLPTTCASCPSVSLAALRGAPDTTHSASLVEEFSAHLPCGGDASAAANVLNATMPTTVPSHALLQIICRNCAVSFHKMRPTRAVPPCDCTISRIRPNSASSSCQTTSPKAHAILRWCLNRDVDARSTSNSTTDAHMPPQLTFPRPVAPCPSSIFALPRILAYNALHASAECGDDTQQETNSHLAVACSHNKGYLDITRSQPPIPGCFDPLLRPCLFSPHHPSSGLLAHPLHLAELIHDQYRALAVGPQAHLRVTQTTYHDSPPAASSITSPTCSTASLCSFFPTFAAAALSPPFTWILFCLALAQSYCDPIGPYSLPAPSDTSVPFSVLSGSIHTAPVRTPTGRSTHSTATCGGKDPAARAEAEVSASSAHAFLRQQYLRSMMLKDLSLYVTCRVVTNDCVVVCTVDAEAGALPIRMHVIVDERRIPLFADYSVDILSHEARRLHEDDDIRVSKKEYDVDLSTSFSSYNADNHPEFMNAFWDSILHPLSSFQGYHTPRQTLEWANAHASLLMTEDGTWATINAHSFAELSAKASQRESHTDKVDVASSIYIWRAIVGDIGAKAESKYEKAIKQERDIIQKCKDALCLCPARQ